jgi:actin related protein 2/3 complex subunit 2
LYSTISNVFDNCSEKREAVDITLADFDGVSYHVTTNPSQRNIVTVSLSWGCISQDLKQFDIPGKIRTIYGPLSTSPESGYDVSLQFDLDNIQDKAALPGKVALLKRHVMAVPFIHVFDTLKSGGSPIVTINYRTNEAIYLKTDQDRVVVVFSINFKDKDDVVVGKVFLQEMEAARKTISNAPSVAFNQKDAPGDIRGARGLHEGDDQGFVTFVLFGAHTHPDRRHKIIDQLMLFRNYLHYHIKCSKAYMHTRMRLRVEELLQVLNRAKMKKANKEMKTISGRTFKRDK